MNTENIQLADQQTVREHWRLIPVNDVIVRERQRQVNLNHVQTIRESFRDLKGHVQLQPIVVTDEMILIDGAHRLAAAKAEGWQYIGALVFSDVDEAQRQRLEAEANLVRLQLSPVELEETWRTIYEPALREASRRKRSETAKQVNAARWGGDKLEHSSDDTETRDGFGNVVSSNLLETTEEASTGSKNRMESQAKKLTGASLNTLKKVKEIREVAADESLPESTRNVAKASLEALQRVGASVDREYRRVVAARDKRTDKQVSFNEYEKFDRLAKGVVALQKRIEKPEDINDLVELTRRSKELPEQLRIAQNSTFRVLSGLLVVDALASERPVEVLRERMAAYVKQMQKDWEDFKQRKEAEAAVETAADAAGSAGGAAGQWGAE